MKSVLNQSPPVKPLCRHCGRRVVSRPRGLCWPCYYSPETRKLYPPSTTPYDDPELPDCPLPAGPTTAPIGSPDKVDVMADRARARVALFHPDDNPDCRPGLQPPNKGGRPKLRFRRLLRRILDAVRAEPATVPEIAGMIGLSDHNARLRNAVAMLCRRGRIVRQPGRAGTYHPAA